MLLRRGNQLEAVSVLIQSSRHIKKKSTILWGWCSMMIAAAMLAAVCLRALAKEMSSASDAGYYASGLWNPWLPSVPTSEPARSAKRPMRWADLCQPRLACCEHPITDACETDACPMGPSLSLPEPVWV